MSGAKSKYWCVTVWAHNTELGIHWIPRINVQICSYAVCYREFGSHAAAEQNAYHFHLYLEMIQRCRMSTIKNMLGENTAHCEIRRGTQKDAINYVKNVDQVEPKLESTFITEIGAPTEISQGHRSDLKEVVDIINSRGTILDVYMQVPTAIIRHYAGIERLIFLRDLERGRQWRDVQVYLYLGPTGVGKSRRAFEENPDAYSLIPQRGATVWWDGYSGQDCVIIDEYHGEIPLNYFIRLMDGNPLSLSVKGAFVAALYTRVILTSTEPIRNWYPMELHRLPELERRIHVEEMI